LLLAICAGPLLAEAVIAVTGLSGVGALVVRLIGLAISLTLTIRLVVHPLVAAASAARLERDSVENELRSERAEEEFRRRFDLALADAETESDALRIGLRAVAEIEPESEVAVLLALPDEPRIGWHIELRDGQLMPATPVVDAPSCRALQSGGTVTAASSHSLDACAHAGGDDIECCTTCMSLRLGERSLGVVCLTGAPGENPTPRSLTRIEWVVERIGLTVNEIRKRRGPSRTGRPDPLTGLPGTSVMHHHMRDLMRSLVPFCTVVVDIDGVAEFEDDQRTATALRLLATTLSDTLRPLDVVCRLDGAGFGVVLGHCNGDQALSALDRVRESLVLAESAEGVDPFSFSAGVVESHRATSLDELVDLAIGACMTARTAGGNRAIMADTRRSTQR
jgi:hypothetical protein